MLELYFILYRVPKTMTRLARERNRSAIAWSLLGIAVWIGAELVVMFGFGMLYGLGILIFNWPEDIPAGLKLLAYVVALLGALGSVTLLSRILRRLSVEESFAPPPPPPDFDSEPNRVA